jgi:hypothetical protein
MKYGPHTQLVDEVVALAEAGPMRLRRPLPTTMVGISDFDEAKRLAWEDVYGVDEFTWTDIRELKCSEVHEVGYRTDWYCRLEQGDELLSFGEVLRGHVERRLPPRFDAVFDDVEADLANIARARMLFGQGNAFWELLLAAYSAGGWPCGWAPQYPDGHLIVYVPDAS